MKENRCINNNSNKRPPFYKPPNNSVDVLTSVYNNSNKKTITYLSEGKKNLKTATHWYSWQKHRRRAIYPYSVVHFFK